MLNLSKHLIELIRCEFTLLEENMHKFEIEEVARVNEQGMALLQNLENLDVESLKQIATDYVALTAELIEKNAKEGDQVPQNLAQTVKNILEEAQNEAEFKDCMILANYLTMESFDKINNENEEYEEIEDDPKNLFLTSLYDCCRIEDFCFSQDLMNSKDWTLNSLLNLLSEEEGFEDLKYDLEMPQRIITSFVRQYLSDNDLKNDFLCNFFGVNEGVIIDIDGINFDVINFPSMNEGPLEELKEFFKQICWEVQHVHRKLLSFKV